MPGLIMKDLLLAPLIWHPVHLRSSFLNFLFQDHTYSSKAVYEEPFNNYEKHSAISALQRAMAMAMAMELELELELGFMVEVTAMVESVLGCMVKVTAMVELGLGCAVRVMAMIELGLECAIQVMAMVELGLECMNIDILSLSYTMLLRIQLGGNRRSAANGGSPAWFGRRPEF
ncbi:hypothetical protein Plhal703r1_c19g0084971 [Plasmopara halstedii]